MMTGIFCRGSVRTAGALCLALLAAACEPSSDDSNVGSGGSGGSGGTGGDPKSGGLIQGLQAALGNSAIALQNTDTNATAFWPEPATDENDEWLGTILGAYDGTTNDGAANGHYLVTQPTEASLDFELEAETSAGPYRAFVGPDWLTIFLLQTGASGFRVNVTCSDVEVNASGTGEAVVLVGQDLNDTTNGSIFCLATDGSSRTPFSQPTTSFEVDADADGYAVMEYFEVTVRTLSAAAGDTASAKARVHMAFTALP
jgi:hypothetical protein